jgi:hypothetical protein
MRLPAKSPAAPPGFIIGLPNVLKILHHTAGFIAGCCFGYSIGSLLVGEADSAMLYGALAIGLLCASVLSAEETCDVAARQPLDP